MPEPILFGISNCDTVRKARRWLEQRDLAYRFHDFRKDGLTSRQIKSWLKQVDWEALLNKRGRTWRELSEQDKKVHSANQAVDLCVRYPALIKRPVLDNGGNIEIGFDPERYSQLFKQ